MAKITINGVSIDPVAQEQTLSAFKLHSKDASKSNFILIQTISPLDKGQRDELKLMSVEILEYVPENTYICGYQPAKLDIIRKLPYVAWANVYLRTFKMSPALLGLTARGSGQLFEMAEKSFPLSNEKKKVDLVLHRGVESSVVLDKVAAAAGVEQSEMKAGRNKIRLSVKCSLLPELARIDEVRHIEEVRPFRLFNDVARRVLGLENNNGPSPFMGEDQIVAVADTGLDKGSPTAIHPAFKGKVKKIYALGRNDQSDDPDGHGTHVSGSILSECDSAILHTSMRGTAPGAKLVFQSLLDADGNLGGIPEELQDLFQGPYRNDHARIHSNSWGISGNNGCYNQYCWEVDDFVWRHRDLVVCFSAGNDGADTNGCGQIDPGSMGAPAAAKNCITVGASESLRPAFAVTYGEWDSDRFGVEPIASDKLSDNCEGMAAFSSRGPTSDGRIKPDLVAPGTFILSTRSRATRDEGWQLSDDPLYCYMGGTSMANPLAAGCAAVAREYLIKARGVSNPSAALVKALLINGARNIAGQYVPSEAGPVPNHAEGFGLIDMTAILLPEPERAKLTVQDEKNALDSGGEEHLEIQVPAASLLKVTLVWTDPPGEALQNDLDLIVVDGEGNEIHGNGRPGARGFDRKNNVEQVVWQNPRPGNYRITVRAFRIAKDPQSYALVVRWV